MAHPRSRKPVDVGKLTEQVLRDLRPDDTDLAIVTSAWATAVGEAIRRHAVPVGVRDGVLHVRCESGAWASELRALGGDVLRQIRRSAPSVRLRTIRTSIGRIEVMEPESTIQRPPPRPATPTDWARAHELVDDIDDDRMRAALERAIVATRDTSPDPGP